jgi:hypothetical protein
VLFLIKQESNPIYGLYNVGWILFNFNNHETKEIVKQWGAECLNSCSDIPNPGKNLYADQKYLDSWPQQLKKLKSYTQNIHAYLLGIKIMLSRKTLNQ